MLTDRGTVTIDERTNVLIVKDTQEALARAEGLVRNLDTETPGVLIESRIVEAAVQLRPGASACSGAATSASARPPATACPSPSPT